MIHLFNNCPIYYTRKGEGPAFVFLHGFLESSTMWKDITPQFTQKQTVICIDFPGFGKSDTVQEIHSMELMAQITAEILSIEAIKDATIIGHSMGGYVALALAETAPQLIKKLVLLNSSPFEDSDDRKINRNRALVIIEKNKDAFITMAISNLFTEKERSVFPSEIAALKEEALQLNPKGIKAAITGMRDRENRVSVLEKMGDKTIIISGIEDAIAPIDELCKISEYTKSIFYEVAGGHMSWISNRPEIVTILQTV